MLLLKLFFVILTRALRNGGQQISARISNIGGDIWPFLIIGGDLSPSMSMVVTPLNSSVI